MAKPQATIRDVARAAGLSVASISRVLNGHDHVHPETRKRVLETMDALGYIPNAAARSLSTAKSHAIGVVLPDLYGEFFGEFVRGIDKVAGERGYLLLLSNMHADRALAVEAVRTMRGRVDGLIVMAPQLSGDDLAGTLPAGLPCVLVNSAAEAQHHNLRIDNHGGVMLMVQHLLAGGARRIVHIAGPPENLDGAARAEAFRAAMAAQAPDLPAMLAQGDFSDTSGEAAVLQLREQGVAFDAVFAANDMMAIGAMRALRAAGVRVPQDVVIAGFDDVPLARYLDLTTLRVDIAGIGERAIDRLIDELEGGAPAPALENFVPTLVARTTTAPKAAAKGE